MTQDCSQRHDQRLVETQIMPRDEHRNSAFKHIACQNCYARFPPQNPDRVGEPDVAAATFLNINATPFADYFPEGYRPAQIGEGDE